MTLGHATISLSDFENYFKSHYAELCSYAHQFLSDIAASEEIVQEFFVKFWENREKQNLPKSPRAYFYTSIKNACYNELKHLKIKEQYKQYNANEMEQTDYSPNDELEAKELDHKIRLAIEELPQARKKIFILSRYEGLKYKEIAEQLNISIKTVENQMGNAIKYMRKELSEYIVSLIIIIQNLL